MAKFRLKRAKSDRGDSELVSLLILLSVVVGILFSTIDASLYFTNRSNIQSFARDAARSVAIMGGDGTSGTQTAIEAQYGANRGTVCNSDLASDPVTKKAFTGDLSNIECGFLNNISKAGNLVNVEIESIVCSPDQVSYITQRTECKAVWRYKSIPASGLTLIKKPEADGTVSMMSENGLVALNTTVGTSESEVNLSGVDAVSR